MLLDSYLFTNAGGRGYNEDACAERLLDDGGLFVLADGLGGSVHGELAADCAVKTVTLVPPPPGVDGKDWLEARIDDAQERILALQAKTHANTKSTLVSLLIRGRQAVWAHVGDSRLYVFRDGELLQVTQDHSVAYKKYKSGQIERWQIGTDEDQSSLLRALGNAERYTPDFGELQSQLQPGDAFLLCSDGVWEYLHDSEIMIDLLKSETAEDWAQFLLSRVLSRIDEGNDNLSLVTVIVGERSKLP